MEKIFVHEGHEESRIKTKTENFLAWHTVVTSTNFPWVFFVPFVDKKGL